MDRGRSPDDGPDDVEAAPDHDTIDPTADAAGSSTPSGASDAAAAGVGPSTDEVAPGGDGPPDADVDDSRPAAWLADVRARAPWLLEPGGALDWRATVAPGPDIVPHGVTPPALSFGGGGATGRGVDVRDGVRRPRSRRA